MTDLLADHHVKYWKVAGEGEGATVVLRLHSKENRQAAICRAKQHNVNKNPSQLRRDRQRAQQFYNKKVRDSSVDTSDNLRNHARTTSGTISRDTYDKAQGIRDTQKMSIHADEHVDSGASCVVNIEARESRSHSLSKVTGPASQQSIDSTCVATDSDNFTSGSDTEEPVEKLLAEAEKNALEREYTLGDIKELAVEMTMNARTRKKLHCVLDKTKNKSLKRVVYKASSKQLLAKSDDFIFTYDCIKAETLYWAFNRDKVDMSSDEAERLAFIEETTDVRRKLYRREIDHVTKDLHALVNLLRLYLQT